MLVEVEPSLPLNRDVYGISYTKPQVIESDVSLSKPTAPPVMPETDIL